MDTKAAAKIFEELGDSQLDLVVETLRNMKKDVAAEIISEMSQSYAAKVTEKLSKVYGIELKIKSFQDIWTISKGGEKMITQHLIPDLLQNDRFYRSAKVGGHEKSSSSQFKDTLDLAVEKSYAWQSGTNPMNMQWISKTGLISVCKTKTYWTQPKQRKEDRTEPSLLTKHQTR